MAEQKSSRRRFLGGAAGVAGVAMALVNWKGDAAAAASAGEQTSQDLIVGPLGGASSASADKRAAATKFLLDLGKDTAGWVMSAEGGYATSEVVVEKLGTDQIAHKHIAGVKYEEIEVNAGAGLNKSFYEWIKS